MTYNLSPELQSLLAPQALLTAADILKDRSLIPALPGIYGWWFDGELPGLPLEGTLQKGNHRLLYIGIAPQAPSMAGRISQSNLRKRICRNHLGNRIASSTLRRSLAALLSRPLDLKIWVNEAGKKTMGPSDEAKLTGWISTHAQLTLLAHDRPWKIEHELLSRGDPAFPMNIDSSNHLFRHKLLQLRAV